MMPSSKGLQTEDTKLLLHAYLDGELPAADALAIQQKIAADPALGGQFETYKTLQHTLRARFPREPFPTHLRTRIDATIRKGRRPVKPTWMGLAAAVLLAVAVSSTSTWLILRSNRADLSRSAEKIAYPHDLGIKYATVTDDPSDLIRDLFADPAALDAVRSGRPLPYGTVLVRNVYDIERDAAGLPLKDANGSPVKSKLRFTAVMEKHPGQTGGYPAGEWQYRSFAPDGTPMADSSAECFACHNKARNRDFVFSFDQMKLVNH